MEAPPTHFRTGLLPRLGRAASLTLGFRCVSSNATDPGAAYICHFDPATPTSKVIDDCRKPGGACPGGL